MYDEFYYDDCDDCLEYDGEYDNELENDRDLERQEFIDFEGIIEDQHLDGMYEE